MATARYLNFDLLIEGGDGAYKAFVIDAPSGQASTEFKLPFSELELEKMLLRLSRPRRREVFEKFSPEETAVRDFGRQLFDAVFQDGVRTLFYHSLDYAKQQNAGLRLRFRITSAPELAELPWEYLYDSRLASFLALSSATSIVRYLDMAQTSPPFAVTPPLNVLVMTANPIDQTSLETEAEWQKIEASVSNLTEHGLLQLTRLPVATLSALQQQLRRNNYHILHIVGDGWFDEQAQTSGLFFEDEEGNGFPVTTQQLSTLIQGHHTLRLVFLNAYEGTRSLSTAVFGKIAHNLVQQGLPAAITMQFVINDSATQRMVRELYSALVDNCSIDVALTEARKAIYFEDNNIEWGAPVLYSQVSDGQLFDIQIPGAGRLEQLRVESKGVVEAAQARRLEQVAIMLESVSTVEEVRAVYHDLAAGDLIDPLSALLRRFSRISQDVDAALRQESTYNQRQALYSLEDRLDSLYLELSRSNESYAVRAGPIAAQWRQIIAVYTRELAETAELRQEIDSPYITGVPLTDQQAIFVGRTDLSVQIEQLLTDRRRPPLLLYGQRRMGKTSLLLNLGRMLRTTIVPMFIDLQGAPTQASDHAGFLYNLARGMIQSASEQRQMLLPSLSREALSQDPFTRFDEWLDDVERVLGKNTALLLLDEFEALDHALETGRFDPVLVLGMLRHLIQHRPRFKVLLAGSHTLEELQRWSSYLINVQVVKVGYLKAGETRQLVEYPVDDFTLRYEPDASQRVLDLTRGHPFLVQLLCEEIVALKNEQEPAMRRLTRLADVEAAIPEALDHGRFFFDDIQQNQLDKTGVDLLCQLAAQGEGVVLSRKVLERGAPRHNSFGDTLALLLQRDLIEPVGDGFRFQVELIRCWFARQVKPATETVPRPSLLKRLTESLFVR